MSSTATQVGEIFSAAGTAFTKLAELTILLQVDEHAAPTIQGEKWDDEDVEMLHSAVKRFGEDLNRLTERIKEKHNQLAKNNVKKRKFDESGVTYTVNSNNNSISPIPPSSSDQAAVAQGTVSS